ncbi:SDR family oxidoreductase [Granulicella sp. dw_53]|uniref:SDR family oxidoreductase n=1 Tax=Granulicella sp. dw_53 TaxID=2719792 RepID=UPI001BD2770A|nr:SDR family oxidoreductase [Granulicella sp. dw_53]
METNKTIFITGTSSGLGKLTAIHFAKQGWNVAATMRSPERETELTAYKNIQIFKLDVTDPEQVKTAAAQAIAAFHRIDVVVNNAGIGSYGPLEFAAEGTIDHQFEVNVRGPIHVIRAFLPHFRANKGGMFVNISSFMGVTTAVPTGSLYNMSKFALEGLTEGLYYELKPLNIELRLIEQGGSKGNNFTSSVVWNANEEVKDYDALTEKVRSLFKAAAADQSRLDDPQDIVDEIYAVATGKNRQFRTLVGDAGKGLMALRSKMPIEQYLETIAAQFG